MPVDDPYYNRKQVPDQFIQDVGITGMSAAEEHDVRERKLSVGGVDVRKFFHSKKHYDDPYYGRKSVDKSELVGVGDTGLSQEQEASTRERKLSVQGVDVRKFWDSKKHYDDPYYGRKKISNAETVGVGELNMTEAEAYDNRERKQSVFQSSGDPFAELSNKGHRQSVSAAALGPSQEATRRRSSVNPNAAGQFQTGKNGVSTNTARAGGYTTTYEQIVDPDAVAPHETVAR